MAQRFFLTCFFLIFGSLCASAQTPAADDKNNTFKQFTSRAAQVAGAASACREISPARVRAVVAKMSEVIRTSVASDAEFGATLKMFESGYADSARAAEKLDKPCENAERDLAALERTATLLLQFPVNAGGAAPPLAAGGSAAPAPATASVRGVTDKEIRFGISAPLSGSAKELGNQMRLGIETAFSVTNAAGGVNGRMLRLIPADDGYEPARTAETIKNLYENEQVFGFIGNVGTPTAAVALPFALERRMLFFGAFTGAMLLRRDPPDRYVFNYRASYPEETEAVVRYLVKVRRIKPEQIAVFAQQDSFGDSGYAGVAKIMRVLRGGDAPPPLRLNYKRNTVEVGDALVQLGKQNAVTPIRAIVMVATYRAAAKFIEKARDIYPNMIYTNVSFVGSTALAEELMLLGPKFAQGVIVTQVVPAVEGYSSIVLEYKNALNKYFPGEPPDYVSLEGYITALVLIEGLKRAGPQFDTERLVDALESIKDLDLGLGTILSFSKTKHQASNKVWATQINAEGKFEAIDLD